jgi:hypothetical protein
LPLRCGCIDEICPFDALHAMARQRAVKGGMGLGRCP